VKKSNFEEASFFRYQYKQRLTTHRHVTVVWTIINNGFNKEAIVVINVLRQEKGYEDKSEEVYQRVSEQKLLSIIFE